MEVAISGTGCISAAMHKVVVITLPPGEACAIRVSVLLTAVDLEEQSKKMDQIQQISIHLSIDPQPYYTVFWK